jgi:hypothetical protein
MITPMPKTILVKKFSSTSSFSASNYNIKIYCTSHADGKFQNFGYPTPNVWVKRPILVDKKQLFEISK